jgi:transposase InsO family protein
VYPAGNNPAQECGLALRELEGEDRVIKEIYSDNAPEFKKMCEKRLVSHPTSTPYISTSNSLAERRNRLVLEGARALLEKAGAGANLWPCAAKHWCSSF